MNLAGVRYPAASVSPRPDTISGPPFSETTLINISTSNQPREKPRALQACDDWEKYDKILGIGSTMLVMYLYYGFFFTSIPTASLEHTGMYDYIDEYPVLKTEVGHQRAGMDQPDYYYDSVVDDDNSRNKRQSTETVVSSTEYVSTASSAAGTGPGAATAETPSSTTEASHTTRSRAKNHHTTPTTTTEATEYDPDFHLSNIFMDSVFAHSERANITQALGLCRKGADIKIPEFKATLFPAEQASDILSCINDLLKNQTKKQICIQLDPEMNAYLKWLILTGEPREKHKPTKIGLNDDFLFPSTPCASEGPQQTPLCLVEQGFNEGSDD